MSVDASRLMTVPEEIVEHPFLTVTGNDYVSLPEIDEFGRVKSVTFLHRGLGGLVELRGEPFLAPYLHYGGGAVPLVPDGDGLRPEQRDLLDWIPEFTWRDIRLGGLPARLTARVVAPPTEKGFAYVLELERLGEGFAEEPVAAELGVALDWKYTSLRIFSSRPLEAALACRYDPWTRSLVCEAKTPTPLLSVAINASEDLARREFSVEKASDDGRGGESYQPRTLLRAGVSLELAAGEKGAVAFYVAVQREEDGARTTSMHFRRLGQERLQAETEKWLTRRRRRLGEDGSAWRAARRADEKRGVERVLNRNLLFNYFFATGKTLDTEELVTVTSRSPRYYVSAAFWSRDALLWSFPGLLVLDRERAREALIYAFRCGTKNVGEHAQYIDGASLYPGFELDEAAAYLVALGKYLEETDDWPVTKDSAVLTGMERVLAAMDRWRRPVGEGGRFLVATFLDPSDDPVTKPFLTYDNVLTWRAWIVAAAVYERLGRADRAFRLREDAAVLEAAIKQHCVVPGPYGPMFAWAVDGEGGFTLYDNPPGSLELVGLYGFPVPEAWANTRRWVWSRENRFFREGRFAAPSSAHTPHPWPMAVANRLLAEAAGGGDPGSGPRTRGPRAQTRAIDEAVAFLAQASMDNGLACESVDPGTGAAKTGAAFATAAGFIAYALWAAARKFLPIN